MSYARGFCFERMIQKCKDGVKDSQLICCSTGMNRLRKDIYFGGGNSF